MLFGKFTTAGAIKRKAKKYQNCLQDEVKPVKRKAKTNVGSSR